MPHKLLLADDSVTIQRVIELTFADEDVQVIAVGNGRDAIERAQRDRPDIVLADVGMPERNGYEVAAFIKGTPALANIPVVLLTGAFEPIDESRARSVGCDGVLVKPFEPQLVISRVKDLLAGRQPSGMWSSAPVAQGPVRAAAPPAERRTADAHPDPLEAYFDQLDAAFASAGTGPALSTPAQARDGSAPQRTEPVPTARRSAPTPAAAAPAPPAAPRAARTDDLGSWDPELRGDPTRPAPVEVLTFPRAVPDQSAHAPEPSTAPDPRIQSPEFPGAAAPAPSAPATAAAPSLVDAFAALLSAESRTKLSASSASASTSAQSVLGDDALIGAVAERVIARLSEQSRPTILDVAERLVREEIDRIKRDPSST
ncbi:MAG TPA: response regulator [Vicinamibacterales bacterium]